MKSEAIKLIQKAREKDIKKGFDVNHNKLHHKESDLALVSTCYGLAGLSRKQLGPNSVPPLWPWRTDLFKDTPKDRVNELVKAGKFITAALELEIHNKELELNKNTPMQIVKDPIFEAINNNVKFYNNFPKNGVNFIDILPLFSIPKHAKLVIQSIIDSIEERTIVVLPEARGFIFVGALTMEEIPCVLLRKEGKVPGHEGDLQTITYEKEYGKDVLQYRFSDLVDAGLSFTGEQEPNLFTDVNVVILDDVLATGNTALAIAESLKQQDLPFNIHISKFIFLCEIEALQGRDKLETIAPVISLYTL